MDKQQAIELVNVSLREGAELRNEVARDCSRGIVEAAFLIINTLRSGGATKIFVEFLDRDYQQVANDGRRVIDLGQAATGTQGSGSGSISPPRLTVAAGIGS